MKIGVYVGSFNPVHKGHIKIVKHLLRNKYLDKVIIIPTSGYWNKMNLVDINDRINMLKLYEDDNILINTDLNSYPYTYEIFEKLSKIYKQDELSLIIGADNIINFDKWKNYMYLTKFNFIIINRDLINVNYYLEKFSIKNKIIVNDLPVIDSSSTLVRKLVKENNFKDLKKYVDDDVLDYILSKNLYK